MKAQLIVRERRTLPVQGFVEIVIWQLPEPVPPCTHSFKYRLVYIVGSRRVVGFDNERGKGAHYHFGRSEHPYTFTDISTLLADFDAAVERWNNGYRGT